MTAHTLTARRPRKRGAAPDQTAVEVVVAAVVDEWERAWGVVMSWAPGAVVWFPKQVCRRSEHDPHRFMVPAWFEDTIALKAVAA